MSNINKIKVSGTTYSIQDENACKVVELTQAQYDELPTTAKTSNSLFVITDATAGDLSNYYTKSETSGATEISTALNAKADTATTYTKTETDNAITAATSTKQDTLVSGTNIKTINNESILGEGNITIQGGSGSITIDQSLDSGSTNAVANSAITNAINSKENHLTNYLETWTILKKYSKGCNALYFTYRKNDKDVTGWFPFANINGKSVESENNFSLVETSAITTSVTSSSTDSQVPSTKAVYDQLGGIKLVKLTQSEYDSLSTKDSQTLYIIVN